MSQGIKYHLLELQPGDRFRLVEFPGADVFEIVGRSEKPRVADAHGKLIATAELAAMNGGGLFVFLVPKLDRPAG